MHIFLKRKREIYVNYFIYINGLMYIVLDAIFNLI